MATIASNARRVAEKAQSIAERTYESGHFRRARQRLDRAMAGRAPQDVMIQATLAAFISSVCLRVLRSTPIGAFAVRWAPMAVFAAVYQARLAERKR